MNVRAVSLSSLFGFETTKQQTTTTQNTNPPSSYCINIIIIHKTSASFI
jgi:hypothetical protein